MFLTLKNGGRDYPSPRWGYLCGENLGHGLDLGQQVLVPAVGDGVVQIGVQHVVGEGGNIGLVDAQALLLQEVLNLALGLQVLLVASLAAGMTQPFWVSVSLFQVFRLMVGHTESTRWLVREMDFWTS